MSEPLSGQHNLIVQKFFSLPAIRSPLRRQARKISPPTGTRSPERPARSQSLYLLSYPAPDIVYESQNILLTNSLKLLNKFDQKYWMKQSFVTMQAHDNQYQYTSVTNSWSELSPHMLLACVRFSTVGKVLNCVIRNCVSQFDVCVTVHLWYNSINSQLDATITIY